MAPEHTHRRDPEAPTPTATAVTIREERVTDAAAVRLVLECAFEGPDEAALVERLRSGGKVVTALVAEEAGAIVGHILFSSVTIEPPHASWNALGLAPVAVDPSRQRQGIGVRLVREGLHRCRVAGRGAVVVLGDPTYYRRFGFARARDAGLDSEYDADEAFMVLALAPDALAGIAGLVRYEPEFGETGC